MLFLLGVPAVEGPHPLLPGFWVLFHPLLPFAQELEAKLDVPPHRSPGEEGVLLEDNAPVVARADDFLPVQGDLAAGGVFQPGDDVQQGGLAAAGGPHYTDKLVFIDGQVYTV